MKFDNYKHMQAVIKSCHLRYDESLYKEIIACNFPVLKYVDSDCFQDIRTYDNYLALKQAQQSENCLCEKHLFSLVSEAKTYVKSIHKQLRITNEKIEIVDGNGDNIIRQVIFVDQKSNEISNIQFEYYDKEATLFMQKKYDLKMDLCDNLEKITKEHEMLCDFKVKISRIDQNIEKDRIRIQMSTGDNIDLLNRTFLRNRGTHFYYFAKYFYDELNIPEFLKDKNLSKVLRKAKQCEYFS